MRPAKLAFISGLMPVEAIVANDVLPRFGDMIEYPLDKMGGAKLLRFMFAVAVVSIAEAYLMRIGLGNPMVANRPAFDVTGQIPHHASSMRVRRLNTHIPFLPGELLEALPLGRLGRICRKRQLTLMQALP